MPNSSRHTPTYTQRVISTRWVVILPNSPPPRPYRPPTYTQRVNLTRWVAFLSHSPSTTTPTTAQRVDLTRWVAFLSNSPRQAPTYHPTSPQDSLVGILSAPFTHQRLLVGFNSFNHNENPNDHPTCRNDTLGVFLVHLPYHLDHPTCQFNTLDRYLNPLPSTPTPLALEPTNKSLVGSNPFHPRQTLRRPPNVLK